MSLTKIVGETVSGSPADSLSTGEISVTADNLYLINQVLFAAAEQDYGTYCNGDTTNANYSRGQIPSLGGRGTGNTPLQTNPVAGGVSTRQAFIAVVGDVVMCINPAGCEHDNSLRMIADAWYHISETDLTGLELTGAGTNVDAGSKLEVFDLGNLPEVFAETVSGSDVGEISSGTITALTNNKTYLLAGFVRVSAATTVKLEINGISADTDYRVGKITQTAHGDLSARAEFAMDGAGKALVVALIEVVDNTPTWTLWVVKEHSTEIIATATGSHLSETAITQIALADTNTKIADGTKLQLLEWT